MKKLLSLILCLVFVFSLAACKDKADESGDKIDIEYYAKLGQIPETEYTLGTDAEKIKKELSEKADESENDTDEDSDHSQEHDEPEFYYSVKEKDGYVEINNGTNCYYYKKEGEKKGISYIVNYGTAFGIETGTFITDVKDMLGEGVFYEEEITEDNAFFATSVYNASMLIGEFGDNAVVFVFSENELYATAIYTID